MSLPGLAHRSPRRAAHARRRPGRHRILVSSPRSRAASARSSRASCWAASAQRARTRPRARPCSSGFAAWTRPGHGDQADRSHARRPRGRAGAAAAGGRAGWRAALAAGGALALVSATLTLIVYRSPAGASGASAAAWPRLGELRVFLRRPRVIVVFLSGLALSVAQSRCSRIWPSTRARHSRSRRGRRPDAGALAGRAARAAGSRGRDQRRFFGGRRRPGVVVNALIGAGAMRCWRSATGCRSRPGAAGARRRVGAFGWVGLYFALVAEIARALCRTADRASPSRSLERCAHRPPVFGLLVDRRLVCVVVAGAGRRRAGRGGDAAAADAAGAGGSQSVTIVDIVVALLMLAGLVGASCPSCPARR